MKRALITLLTTLILLVFPPIRAIAQDSSPVEPDSGAVVAHLESTSPAQAIAYRLAHLPI